MVEIRLVIRDAALEPQGAKEAIAQALEGLGRVEVVECKVLEPEQMRIGR